MGQQGEASDLIVLLSDDLAVYQPAPEKVDSQLVKLLPAGSFSPSGVERSKHIHQLCDRFGLGPRSKSSNLIVLAPSVPVCV